MKLIKLTKIFSDDSTMEIYLNTDYIVQIRPGYKGATIDVKDYGLPLNVTETAEDVIGMIQYNCTTVEEYRETKDTVDKLHDMFSIEDDNDKV